jgi:hypothetical protein
MTSVALLLALALPAADAETKDTKKAPTPAARVTVTAPLACLHCTFGEGDGCAACLKLDDKTPLVLAGKGVGDLEKERFSKKVLVAEGTLSVNKDKRMVLTVDNSHFFDEEKDKGKVPEPGLARVSGATACAHCDLNLAKECTVAIRNGDSAVVLDGKLAKSCAEDVKTITVVGKLFLDKDGVVRLDAKSIDPTKKEEKK